MNFSEALARLKDDDGKKLQRKGWNGKGMYIHLKKRSRLDVDILTPLSYIEMKTVDECLVPWLASQTDILAEDWCVLDLKKEGGN